jgi:hypothetical protein
MLTAEQFKSLKKMNTSKDKNKSSKRIDEDYKATSKAQKAEIEALSGLNVNSFYNAGKTGGASPKVVLSLAQVLGVSPFYYTGQIDEKEPVDDKSINQFLIEIGANEPIKQKRPYNRRSEPKATEPSAEAKAGKPSKLEKIEKAVQSKRTAKKKKVGKFKTSAKSLHGKGVSIAETIAHSKAAPKTKGVGDLSKDEILTLVSALHIRAGLSAEAKKKLDGIKAILLS